MTTAGSGRRRPRWGLFALLAIAVIVVDQATKAVLVGALAPGERMDVLGDVVRFVHSRNSGGLFGLLPGTAGVFAIVSFAVVAAIVWTHARAGRSLVTSIALALLLGGAIGNLIDRLRHQAVIDWVDAGIGATRFWTFNVADSAITGSILLLIGLALLPRLATIGEDG